MYAIAGERSLIWTTNPDNPRKEIKLREAEEILGKTKGGADILSLLGGWQKISDEANIDFGNFDVEKIGGAVLPLPLEARRNTGKSYTIMLAEYLLSEPPEVIAVVLAHELSHLEDLISGRHAPDEIKAHNIQASVRKQIIAGLNLQKRMELDNSKHWNILQ
jgi:hypothetical protein